MINDFQQSDQSFGFGKSVKVDLTISLTQKWTKISVRKHYIRLGLQIMSTNGAQKVIFVSIFTNL